MRTPTSSPKLHQDPSKLPLVTTDAWKQTKDLTARFGTRAILSAGLMTAAACSSDMAVSTPTFADAGNNHTDGKILSNEDSASTTDSNAPSPDVATKLLCDPMPYCPDLKLGLTPLNTFNYYLQSNRWFRVDPTTHQIHQVCEPVKGIPCDETKGETPQKDNCDLPRCPDAKTCDPIPAIDKDGMYSEGIWLLRDFANYPQELYAQSMLPLSDTYGMFGSSVFDGTPDSVVYPMIYDNVPDCKPGEKPKEGESYYTCDVIPTCEKAIPYCEPLPRCEPGQPAMSFIPGDLEKDGPGVSIEDCIYHLGSRLSLLAWPYKINIDPALAKLCGPDGLNPKNHAFVVEAKVNCLPVRECNPGEEPVNTKTPLPITLDLGALGVVESATGASGGSVGPIPSCEPIPSCPKK